jgi:hypothetical protein
MDGDIEADNPSLQAALAHQPQFLESLQPATRLGIAGHFEL